MWCARITLDGAFVWVGAPFRVGPRFPSCRCGFLCFALLGSGRPRRRAARWANRGLGARSSRLLHLRPLAVALSAGFWACVPVTLGPAPMGAQAPDKALCISGRHPPPWGLGPSPERGWWFGPLDVWLGRSEGVGARKEPPSLNFRNMRAGSWVLGARSLARQAFRGTAARAADGSCGDGGVLPSFLPPTLTHTSNLNASLLGFSAGMLFPQW